MREFGKGYHERKRREARRGALLTIAKATAGVIVGGLVAAMAMATPNLTPGVFLSTVVPGMAIGSFLGAVLAVNA